MRHKNYRVWLRGCKLRTWKKHYGNRMNVDGVEYSIEDYNEMINQYKKIKVGDIIFNSFKNIHEPVKEISIVWNRTYQIKNARWLEICFITMSDYIICDLNDEVYSQNGWVI